jgi:hypothetical protein
MNLMRLCWLEWLEARASRPQPLPVSLKVGRTILQPFAIGQNQPVTSDSPLPKAPEL